MAGRPVVETYESDRFNAKSESGSIYIVVEHQRTIKTRGMAGVQRTVPRTFYTLSDGRDVVVTGKDEFKIVDTNELIRKID